jgi:hypothetical protein
MKAQKIASTKVGAHTPQEALVWIDHERALIAEREVDGSETVEVLERADSESEPAFESRTVDEIAEATRVVVTGPAFARTGFERQYVATTRRPDRLLDVEPDRPARHAP